MGLVKPSVASCPYYTKDRHRLVGGSEPRTASRGGGTVLPKARDGLRLHLLQDKMGIAQPRRPLWKDNSDELLPRGDRISLDTRATPDGN